MSATAVIESEQLTKLYGRQDRAALAGVAIQVKAGEIFGFLGPNGAGKTTFIKILLDFIRPTSGSIRILGDQPGALDRTRIGYLPERIVIPGFLTGREFLRYQGRLIGLSGADLETRITRSLERVEMVADADRRVATYSKGMTQRVGLAQVLLGEPELLLLDEPVSGLDPLGIARFRELILEERARGATVFLNSHQLLEVEKTCDRVAILARGKLVAQGRSAELSEGRGLRVEVDRVPDSLRSMLVKYDPRIQIEAAGKTQRFEIEIADAEEERMLPARIVESGARLLNYTRRGESLEETFQRLVREENG